ncbi:MAG TPA: MmgE/PrpD family protein [Hypericibacter adhaerens]|jgi:2-methylcitrate dehydratase PrpD|uniref:2-methylcitrate dehydratase n=1 Tax=Hypericibacter adhaerens TaxID=2602016 RepID=A0A5J6MZD0_9PROT|nr:MmgE/PrpD family protein [Hypericibacter adhaerens]QEX21985.1 2-methylcitrate dehydratase [Hypericibacter adhaerens]HWA45052.1 MmgE/PrpD family protein [Hypericibacter adhaerens]
MEMTRLHSFLVQTRYDGLPPEVRRMAERCLIDLAGTAAAGLATPLSHMIRNHAVRAFGAGEGAPRARLLFDGRVASPLGAAMAGGMTIDSFDAHDGHVLTKGHAGVAILPALLALADAAETPVSGPEFLTALVIGYEVAIRAGIAQHATCPDYHTSGAWNALGVVAVAARLWGLDPERTRHALGIAEYHGPRSQMMRCIDFPTMVKDGSGWGAMCGLSAAYLAADGFTGAPALVVESEPVKPLWADLGQRWRILELYFKPYPVCRWAQPAVEAALVLQRGHKIDPAAIEMIDVETFHEAVRLDQHRPASTEEAQYSLPFPVAAAIVRGRLAPTDVSGEALADPAILAMSDRIRLQEAPDLNARFPAERFARVRFHLKGGKTVASDTTPARGDAERPLADDEILAKFHELADQPLGIPAARKLEERIAALARQADARPLVDALLTAPLPGAAPSDRKRSGFVAA